MSKTPALFYSPKEYVLSLRRSIAVCRNEHASQEHLNYLYSLYGDALDALWSAQQNGYENRINTDQDALSFRILTDPRPAPTATDATDDESWEDYYYDDY